MQQYIASRVLAFFNFDLFLECPTTMLTLIAFSD
jgi:hypothetical protein